MRTLLLTLLAASACAQPVSRTIADLGYQPNSGPAGTQTCPVMVTFNSACCGIDGTTLATLRTHLQTAPNIASVTQFSWGREGEKTLCITPQTPADTAAVASGIRALIPTQPTGSHATTRLLISPAN